MFNPPEPTEDTRDAFGPIGVSFIVLGFAVPITILGLFFGSHATRAQVGDWIGGVFGACAALVGALLLYGAIRLQMNELRIQREELRLTREEMKASREVHDASRRELEAQTRIAQRASVFDLIYKTANLLTSFPPPKGLSGEMKRVTPEYFAAQDFICDLLKSDDITPHERQQFVKQLGLGTRLADLNGHGAVTAVERNNLFGFLSEHSQ